MLKVTKIVLVLGCALTTVACGGKARLRAQAAAGMGCPADQVKVRRVDMKLVAASGCGQVRHLGGTDGWHALAVRAAADMSCPAGDLEERYLGGNRVAVNGCGKKELYEHRLRVGWLSESEVALAPAPAPATMYVAAGAAASASGRSRGSGKSCFLAFNGSERAFCEAYSEGKSCFLAFKNGQDLGWCKHLREGKSCFMAFSNVSSADQGRCERGVVPKRHRDWLEAG